MHPLRTHLETIGLGSHEASVFAALCELTPTTAANIAKKCALSRSSVYTTLGILVGKGLVGTTYRSGVAYFTTTGMPALEHFVASEEARAAKKRATLAALSRELASLSPTSTLPHTVFFEGKDGLQKIYLAMMQAAPHGSVRRFLRDEFIWHPEWDFVHTPAWTKSVETWTKEKELHTKLLLNPSKLEKSKKKFYTSRPRTQVKYLPAAHTVSNFALYIVGDHVAILSLEHNQLLGIHITHPSLAKNYAAVFDGLWNGSK